MSDAANNGAAPIPGDFVDPFNTNLVKEPVAPTAPQNNGQPDPPPPVVDPPPPPPPATAPVFDEAKYIKDTFGWENVEAGRAELTELRKLKDQPITFANPESERLFTSIKEGKKKEVYDILDKDIKLGKAAEMEAKGAISLHLQITHPHYTAQDIDDVLEERYPTPLKPKQNDGEEPAAFEARTAEWTAAVDKINRRITRDSLAAKDDLKKLQSELVLPDINRVDPQLAVAQAQQELDAQKSRDRYLTAIDADYTKITGFNATYKDKEVEIPLAFTITDEEKVVYRDKMKNIDLRTYFGPKWFNEDGSPKVDQIGYDLYWLENKDKIIQKLVNDAGSKRMDHYLKDKKNINLNGNRSEGTFVPGSKEATEKALGEWAFSS